MRHFPDCDSDFETKQCYKNLQTGADLAVHNKHIFRYLSCFERFAQVLFAGVFAEDARQ